MTVLYLIVARGGSKRIPGKNLQRIEGRTLLAWKALAAQRSRSCSQLMLSTDDPLIAAEAMQCGVDVPFCRPAHLATDDARTEEVVRHVLGVTKRHDAVMLLEPTSPFVSPKSYDAAVRLMTRSDADFVFGHVLYLFRWHWLDSRTDLYDQLTDRTHYFSMPTEHALDIDTPHDLELARWLVAHRAVDLSWTL